MKVLVIEEDWKLSMELVSVTHSRQFTTVASSDPGYKKCGKNGVEGRGLHTTGIETTETCTETATEVTVASTVTELITGGSVGVCKKMVRILTSIAFKEMEEKKIGIKDMIYIKEDCVLGGYCLPVMKYSLYPKSFPADFYSGRCIHKVHQ